MHVTSSKTEDRMRVAVVMMEVVVVAIEVVGIIPVSIVRVVTPSPAPAVRPGLIVTVPETGATKESFRVIVRPCVSVRRDGSRWPLPGCGL